MEDLLQYEREAVAYQRGRDAQASGETYRDCPHDHGTILWAAWVRGASDGFFSTKPQRVFP